MNQAFQGLFRQSSMEGFMLNPSVKWGALLVFCALMAVECFLISFGTFCESNHCSLGTGVSWPVGFLSLASGLLFACFALALWRRSAFLLRHGWSVLVAALLLSTIVVAWDAPQVVQSGIGQVLFILGCFAVACFWLLLWNQTRTFLLSQQKNRGTSAR
jgi:hypothetical protein